MRLSNKNLTKTLETEIRQIFLRIIADIRTPEEADILISDLLTETEQLAVAKRLAIAIFLTEGKNYEEIKQNLKVSSATVAKVQESLDQAGIKLALNKVKTDKWAGNWAAKISQTVNNLLGQASKT